MRPAVLSPQISVPTTLQITTLAVMYSQCLSPFPPVHIHCYFLTSHLRTNTHPQVTWLFRATLDQTALKNNWTNLLPSIVQTGIGNYCEQDVVIPTSWAGSKGIINVVADSPDGILYQCAAVNFVTGTLSDVPTSCNNASGVAATYSADAALSSLPASSAATSTATSTASSTSSTTAAKSSSAASAIVIQPSYGGWAAGLWTATIALATVVACLM